MEKIPLQHVDAVQCDQRVHGNGQAGQQCGHGAAGQYNGEYTCIIEDENSRYAAQHCPEAEYGYVSGHGNKTGCRHYSRSQRGADEIGHIQHSQSGQIRRCVQTSAPDRECMVKIQFLPGVDVPEPGQRTEKDQDREYAGKKCQPAAVEQRGQVVKEKRKLIRILFISRPVHGVQVKDRIDGHHQQESHGAQRRQPHPVSDVFSYEFNAGNL